MIQPRHRCRRHATIGMNRVLCRATASVTSHFPDAPALSYNHPLQESDCRSRNKRSNQDLRPPLIFCSTISAISSAGCRMAATRQCRGQCRGRPLPDLVSCNDRSICEWLSEKCRRMHSSWGRHSCLSRKTTHWQTGCLPHGPFRTASEYKSTTKLGQQADYHTLAGGVSPDWPKLATGNY